MDLAEIRKKSKKKKTQVEEQEHREELRTETSEENLPVPKTQKPSHPPDETSAFGLVDEENLYNNYARKEQQELKEFLCFRLGEEEYGIEISMAKEIIKSRQITEVPRSLDFIIGIISIRGEVVPVFDIKSLLGIDAGTISLTAKFIILQHETEKVGICVDRITQINKISLAAIEPAPMNISGAKHELLRGIAIINDKMIRLLDMEKILNF